MEQAWGGTGLGGTRLGWNKAGVEQGWGGTGLGWNRAGVEQGWVGIGLSYCYTCSWNKGKQPYDK